MWAMPTQVQRGIVGHVGYANASPSAASFVGYVGHVLSSADVGYVGYAYASPSAASVKTCADHLWVMWAMFPSIFSRTVSLTI